MKNKKFLLGLLLMFLSVNIIAQRKEIRKNKGKSSVKTSKYDSMKSYLGYFNFYYDNTNDHIYLEVKELEKQFLYVNSLSEGIGSNDIGLDWLCSSIKYCNYRKVYKYQF